jgi:hypothetical protein
MAPFRTFYKICWSEQFQSADSYRIHAPMCFDINQYKGLPPRNTCHSIEESAEAAAWICNNISVA